MFIFISNCLQIFTNLFNRNGSWDFLNRGALWYMFINCHFIAIYYISSLHIHGLQYPPWCLHLQHILLSLQVFLNWLFWIFPNFSIVSSLIYLIVTQLGKFPRRQMVPSIPRIIAKVTINSKQSKFPSESSELCKEVKMTSPKVMWLKRPNKHNTPLGLEPPPSPKPSFQLS